MRKARNGFLVGGLSFAAAILLVGCSTVTDGGSGGEVPEAASIISANGTEPQNPLIPGNTIETGGGKIVDNIFAGLQYYDADGTPVLDMAESITTEDSKTYTVTVKPGQTFTNGEAVTAESFVSAWKWTATASNAALNSYFFEDIKGFSYEEDTDLDGLQIVDDLTFTIELTSTLADFPLRLGYSAFYPLPSVAFEDMAAFGENPIGNGPYMLAGEGAWQHDEQIDLAVNPDYSGGRKAANGGLTIRFYASADAAYSDLLGGNLDVLDEIPSSALQTFHDDLGERAIDQPAALFQSITIPSDLERFADKTPYEHFQGEEGELRRAAISHAINRAEITDVIFNGTRTPAHDFTSPVIDGYSENVPGSEVLEFDEAKAKELWAKADEISPWSGTFTISYNADSDHQGWVDAVANGIKNTLGIDAEGMPFPTFDEVRTLITPNADGKREITATALRSGWQADYPGLFNFLGPLYGSNAGSNDGDYSNPEVDALLKKGSAASTPEEANEYFQQVQEILFVDLPAIPLWYSSVQGGHSEAVDNVAIDWHSVPLYYQITKSE